MPSVNTALGHLRQQYQNTRSTRIKEVPLPPPNLTLILSLSKEKATVYTPTGTPILTGPYCPRKKIFLLPIGQSPPQQSSQNSLTSANNIQISTLDTKQNLAIWYHRICFCPVVTTWIKAIDAGFFSTWPGLTSKLIKKHLPPSVNTALGHLRHQYQNTRSTRIVEAPLPPPNLQQKTNNAFIFFQTN